MHAETSAPAGSARLRRWLRRVVAFLVLLVALVVTAPRDASGLCFTALVGVLATIVLYPVWRTGWAILKLLRQRRRARYVIFGLPPVLASGAVIAYAGLVAYRIGSDTEPLPPGGPKYVVMIVVDGGSMERALDLFYEGASSRDPKIAAAELNRNFPNISRHFIQNGAYTPNGITIWPSSSVPAHTSVMTGAHPTKTGILGQRHFDWKNRRYTSFIGLGLMRHRKELSRNVRTLFEWFPKTRSVCLLQIANRGCSLYLPGEPRDEQTYQTFLKAFRAFDFLGDRVPLLPRMKDGANALPRIWVMTLPDIDHMAHTKDLDAKEVVAAFQGVDDIFGRIVQLFQSKGLFDDTLFVLTADHGMGRANRHVTIDYLMRDLRLDPYHSWAWGVKEEWGTFECNFYTGTRRKLDEDYNCLALWGGNSDALIYLKGQVRNARGEVIRESWDLKPTEAMLKNYYVRGENINLIETILARAEGVGLIITHPQPDRFDIYSRVGWSRIMRRRGPSGVPSYQYHRVSGKDPLGYAEEERVGPHVDVDEWLTERQWLELTCEHPFPDAPHRIAQSFGHPRSGHMHLVAAEGWDFTPYFACKELLVGSHGSLDRMQSLVPVMFAGKGVTPKRMLTARNVDVVPTILKLCGVEHDGSMVSGVSLVE